VKAGHRNQRIDLIRGISIFLVLFHHFNIPYRLADTWLSQLVGWNIVRAVARNGNYGVTMFFVVSGFLITSHAQPRWGSLGTINPPVFYGLRAARILPCLVLLLAMVNLLGLNGVAIFQNHPEGGSSVSFWLVDLASLTFWMNVLMAQLGWLNYALCVLWSLSVEEVFYFSFPILCRLLRRESRLIALWVLFVIIGPIWRLTHQDDEAGFLYAYLACFDGIAIGCCAALLSKHLPATRSGTAGLQVSVAGSMAFLYLYRPISETNVYGVTLMALGTAVLLITAPRQAAAGSPLLEPLRRCGRLSYELYLFHLTVLGGLQIVSPPVSSIGNKKLLLLLAYLILSIGLAAVIGRFYSEPLNRGLRNRLGTRHETLPMPIQAP
jgi:peptidoglycan/LPS O-acetylase OafA/YrhL